ncbi:MAG: LPS export ABC transporter ATP-binding protein [Phycisphaerales bacterium]|nr:LPS export ABC transporter ATP-binding protein [Phycisphaerales bacterium]
MPLLTVSKLRKTYAGRCVVDDVSFTVDGGEIVGLLGRNGAGKTTSFRITIGMIDPDSKSGGVMFHGRDVSKLAMYQRARLGMGYLSQEPSIFQRLTVEQNLLTILQTQPMSRADRRRRLEELLEQFDLVKTRKQPARTLSGGERRKLEIARALVTDPKLILLDEPFSGVDPRTVENLHDEIRALRDNQNIAILITDHNVHQTLRVCDRAYIIDQGRIFAEGTPKELINNQDVRNVYLGSLFRGDEFDDRTPTTLSEAKSASGGPTTPTITVNAPKTRI